MALSERQAERVAQEKKRMSLRSGDSPAKAERYAQGVRDYAAQQRQGGK
jgi:hypothetical protein